MTINNNNIFGAFTLGEVRSGRLTGEWLNKESVANYGWFGGGYAPAAVRSTVDRIDFSNDSSTASVRGSLSSARTSLFSTGNSNYGWFGGGRLPAQASTVDRIDFSNDSSTASVRGPLNSSKNNLAATANSNYGWFGGGSNVVLPLTVSSTVDRIDFSNDFSTASVRGLLSLARCALSATGNSNYGWFGGGISTTPATVSIVDRIDFSNDFSTASPRGPLSLARYNPAATGNSNYGWFGGGSTATPSQLSTVDRIDLSNDSSTASVRSPLSSGRYSLAATGNSNYGWFGGGTTSPPLVSFSTVDRIDFSNDSVSVSVRGPLSSARYFLAATSGVLNIRRQKAGNYGWFGGGTASPLIYSRVDRIDFSNDSVTLSIRGTLNAPAGRYSLAATGNSNYGWFGGGRLPTTSTVDRIDFSNDSSTASPRGPLSSARYNLAATANSNYGWFGGGYVSPPTSPRCITLVDRIDFSNDSVSTSPRGLLSVAAGRSNVGATGNSNYGWFGGGANPTSNENTSISTVDRIDFSNDSATASQRTNLSDVRSFVAATGNSNYGWFGGGAVNNSSKSTTTIVDRIDFSNDSIPVLVRSPLTIARNYGTATGNSNYGWWAGTPTIPNNAIVERINFANDLVSTTTRGPLSAGRYSLAATSNTNK